MYIIGYIADYIQGTCVTVGYGQFNESMMMNHPGGIVQWDSV